MTAANRTSDEVTMQDAPGTREFGHWLDEHEDLFASGMRVVELGCGLGADALELTSRGVKVTGLDLSVDRIVKAAERAPDASYVVGDMRAGLPFAAGCVEVVVASLSLHYFDRATTAVILRECARILRPDGMLLCRVNVAGERTARWGEGIEIEPDFFEVEPGVFKRFFTPESLSEALDECFDVQLVELKHTTMIYGGDKSTLVARARRKERA